MDMAASPLLTQKTRYISEKSISPWLTNIQICVQMEIVQHKMKEANLAIYKDLTTLENPGKPNVRVIVLLDPVSGYPNELSTSKSENKFQDKKF